MVSRSSRDFFKNASATPGRLPLRCLLPPLTRGIWAQKVTDQLPEQRKPRVLRVPFE